MRPMTFRTTHAFHDCFSCLFSSLLSWHTESKPTASQKGFCTCREHIFTASTTSNQVYGHLAACLLTGQHAGKGMSSLDTSNRSDSHLFFSLLKEL